MKKRLLSLLMVVATLLTVFTMSASAAWYTKSLEFCDYYGISIDGAKVDDKVTRGDAITIICRMYNTKIYCGWKVTRQQAIYWAQLNGISDCTNLNNSITRGQIATIFYRCEGAKQPPLWDNINAFTKLKDVNNNTYYSQAVLWAVTRGLLSGYAEDNTLRADNDITYKELYAMVYKFVNDLDRSDYDNEIRLANFRPIWDVVHQNGLIIE